MEIYLDDYQGQTYHLHSTTQVLPTMVKRPLEGLEGGEPRIAIYDNPGQDGQTVANILGSSSLITLTGSLKATEGQNDQERMNSYEANRLSLNQAIRQQYLNGRPQPSTLRITMPGGSQYQASVFVSNYRGPLEYTTYHQWMLELLNPRGVVESQSATTQTITLPQSGGVVYPVVYPIVYGAASGGSATATNYGDVAAHPIITLYGPIDTPVIINETTGKFLRLNLSLESGQIIRITMATPSIVQGTLSNPPSTNAMGARGTGSSFWSLEPGANVIRLRAASYDTGYATISYRSTWRRI
jgi:hypothetical protein